MERYRNAIEKLGFNYIPQDGFEAWSKIYDGFILFICKVPKTEKYLGSITVGTTEIAIPNYINLEWVKAFENENNN